MITSRESGGGGSMINVLTFIKLKFTVRVLLKMIQRFVIVKKEDIVLLKNAWEWTPV